MFFIENNFLILITSYVLYYANYIALYVIMYVFFYKNNFLMVMHGLWTKYNHDILQKKIELSKKRFYLQKQRINYTPTQKGIIYLFNKRTLLQKNILSP